MTQEENSGADMNVDVNTNANTDANTDAKTIAEQSAEQSKKDIIRYVAIWIVLLMALVLSLILGEFGSGTTLIAVIFAIAFIKAGLVIHFFMHLTLEPWFIKLALGSCFLVLGSFFFGIYPDVTINNAAIVHPEVFKIEVPLHDGDVENGKIVYEVTCVFCHQADGSGMSGDIVMAANFLTEASRLEESDDVLRYRVSNGYSSGGSLRMSPQGGRDGRSEQEILDAITYIRATFGSKEIAE